ncbi:M23 family metallopeptidase [Petroclostridium sp. X23]|jgi:murein DD-endopeptidase MepM/ murein hydrolase activator NlpD|uniref:M23 family metallopeptidase n=1 Tax=Petroclostridium sp. X23 TaxID=3045146 RepID=UPI0024ADD9B2|nr:M23 family metallopeptidase [Petroclostridium sp. X23]WHH57591.1 M23 family metallopeptidase [Petroclostridium sp. X23]
MKKTLLKKLDPDSKGKLMQFLDKKGFYVVLFVCVVIIGATAVLVTRNNLEFYSQNGIIDEEPVIDETSGDIVEPSDIPVIANADSASSTQPADIADEENTNAPDQKKQETAKTNNEQKEKIIVVEQPLVEKESAKSSDAQKQQDQKTQVINRLLPPVDGEVILGYAKENLVYSKTLEEWRTHNGIDIKSDRGTQVKAAADGIIEKIYKDDGLGITIVIDHGNGLKTKYCNLSTDNMVKEKQSVKQGQAISGVGDTAAFEIGDQPHLHFEVIKDGKNVDPVTLLPN